MKYLLDTNTCIRYLNGHAPIIRSRLAAVPLADIAVCAPVKAELYFGSARSQDPIRTLARQEAFLRIFISLPFDDDAARIYGRVRADLATRGSPIGANDLLIAATALTSGLILITHNTGEFSRVTGLGLEDWELP